MNTRLKLASVPAVLIIAACRSFPPPTPPDPPPRFALDSFEADRLWTLDSADNYGLVEYADRHVSDGDRAMLLSFFDNGRGKTMFRREVRFDLSGARRMWLDVFNHSGRPGVKCALAFAIPKVGFFETKAAELAAGENTDVEFDLGPRGWKDGTDTNAWRAASDKVRRVLILVFPGGNKQGAISVDNMRTDVQGADLAVRPDVLDMSGSPESLVRFAPTELWVSCRASTMLRPCLEEGKPGTWLPVDLQARLIRPDGERTTVHGFLKSHDPDQDTLTYAVRLLPDVTGSWRLDLGYVADGRWQQILDTTLECHEAPDAAGVIGIDPSDPRVFADSNGGVFYPIGQNVCWAADYGPYFSAMRGYGGNFARVWICPWNNQLLVADDVTRIDLDAAAAIDDLLASAVENGIYVQLVFAYHGWLDVDWGRNPFNKENGGPCGLARDFWVDPTARWAFRRYLDYAVRRWAACPNVFAWELFNEAGFAPRYEDRDIIDWHREMGRHLKRIDPSRHLVTTSLGHAGRLKKIWQDPSIDFISDHVYNPDLARALNRPADTGRAGHKPYWVQEIGRGWKARDDQVDPDGRHLHHSLWLSWMSASAGTALPWWWDTYIEANDLYAHFAALTAFARDEDRSDDHLRHWMQSVHQESGATIHVQGLLGRQVCFGFVYDPELVKRPGVSPRASLLEAGHRLILEGLLDGDYTMEQWDTYAGKVVQRGRVHCRDARLVLALPSTPGDFAFKLKPVNARELKVTVE